MNAIEMISRNNQSLKLMNYKLQWNNKNNQLEIIHEKDELT